MQTVFLVRCQAFDQMARNVATALHEAGADVVIMPDERQGVTDTGDFQKIGLTEAILFDLGLTGLPDDWGWLCGDVWHYIARHNLPDATHFCLVESDVAFTGTAARRFVSAMQSDPSDLLAFSLGATERPKDNSLGLASLGFDANWGCLFPVTRCSQAACDWMLDLRRRSLAVNVADKVNDEGVLAAAAQSGAFSFRSLEDFLPELFDGDRFQFYPPFLAEALAREQIEDAVFHPVLSLEHILNNIPRGEKKYTRPRLRRVLQMANQQEKSLIRAALNMAKAAAEAASLSAQKELAGTGPRFVALARALGLEGLIKVLDIGANPLVEGDAPYVPLLRSGLAEVYGFEPQAEALATLNANKSPNETYFPDAVGDGRAGKLNIYSAQGFTSLFEVDPDSARYLGFGRGTVQVGALDVTTRRLDDFAGVPQIDVLKIDVQGAETEIITNGIEKLANALVVITEVRLFPIYKDEPRYGDLERALTDQGFEFLRFASLKHVPLSRKHRGSIRRSEFAQAVDGDAIFVRDMRNLERFPDEALKKLAVIADGIIDNADLAIAVLEQLESRRVVPATMIPAYVALLPPEKRR